jgi:hypothetical protein
MAAPEKIQWLAWFHEDRESLWPFKFCMGVLWKMTSMYQTGKLEEVLSLYHTLMKFVGARQINLYLPLSWSPGDPSASQGCL